MFCGHVLDDPLSKSHGNARNPENMFVVTMIYIWLDSHLVLGAIKKIHTRLHLSQFHCLEKFPVTYI